MKDTPVTLSNIYQEASVVHVGSQIGLSYYNRAPQECYKLSKTTRTA